MLCKYKYRAVNQNHYGRCGWYQSDVEDFRNFFKYAKDNLQWVGVELADGEFYYYVHGSWKKGNQYRKYVD